MDVLWCSSHSNRETRVAPPVRVADAEHTWLQPLLLPHLSPHPVGIIEVPALLALHDPHEIRVFPEKKKKVYATYKLGYTTMLKGN